MLKSRNRAFFSAGTKLSGLIRMLTSSLEPRPSSPPDLRPSGRSGGDEGLGSRLADLRMTLYRVVDDRSSTELGRITAVKTKMQLPVVRKFVT